MSDSLRDCLDALAAAARAAGVDEATARAEGEALAATVAERSKGAFADWCEQVGKPGATEEFFLAAKQGNRFRGGPTPLMGQLAVNKSEQAPSYAKALGEVALAATLLGQPGPEAVGTAAMVTSAQLGEARALTPSPTAPGAFDLPGREPVPGVGDDMLDQVRRMGDQVRRQLEAINIGAGAGLAPGPDTSTLSSAPADADTAGLDTPSPSGSGYSTTDGGAQTATQSPDKPAPEEQKPEEPTKTVEELLAELDAMIGLDNVKGEIHRQAAVLRVEGLRKKAGLDTPTITRHLVFNGNPGTGKTTVARLVAGIYRALGLLSKGQLVEVDRSELVAGYLGQTAQKTAEVVKSAEGGVLFIDEAYSLSGDQYGKEAIDTLVKEMEDKRDDLVVIVAGYPLPMAIFISENPGLESRFRTMIEFENYTDGELVRIFEQMAEGADYDTDEAVLARLREMLAEAPRGPSFGNARYVRNVLEAAIGHHAWRLRDIAEPTLEQLRSLDAADLVVPEDDEAEQSEDPVVAEDGTLLPPADAEPGEVVDALEPGDEAAPAEQPAETPIDAAEPTVEVDKKETP
ncbi:AAA family ATPase [Nocardioides bizhenqiangii]|uniref:AAA family ATPase n=1 Tax=Nocardioides bizhenqiangii TaxID=3095076 RepID=A0ABZ0ZUF6_9ACTN|nr:AAA family ATPase [Nocardioides sp. HM61]WQQ27971.1 AAA family ATPase [Nocardioides sp. HM61]